MRRFITGVCLGALFVAVFAPVAKAQKPFTWDEVKARFEANNPTLRAGAIGIDESKADEITAYLRPNPQASIGVDQIGHNSKGPFSEATLTSSLSYLHERRHKRELRLESAQKATGIAVSGQADLERNLIFTLRTAFVGILQGKAVLRVATDNLDYWDQVLKISRDRFQAGDIAQIDLDRLELQRVQFESDLQTAEVNLRTAKIQLLMLLDDRTPVDQFDVLGLYEYNDQLSPLDQFRQVATENRPDLKAAVQSMDKAKTDHQLAVANGSTDPTINFDAGFPGVSQDYVNYTPFLKEYVGFGFSIPLRIFDRNQGEKLRTQLDIDRNQKLLNAIQALVFSDVDSAYALVNSNLILLRPYKAKYLDQATRVRDTVRFSYEHGGAALLDFLNAENDYRSVQLNYVNLVGSYLIAAAQLNLAVGREVIQ
ncbi:MAG TPA: TolC family protein [Candidatus Sulfotelmatobacter sp.]|nr:TolC family protein [Candidatus Sulfotelmatobacter sp.]